MVCLQHEVLPATFMRPLCLADFWVIAGCFGSGGGHGGLSVPPSSERMVLWRDLNFQSGERLSSVFQNCSIKNKASAI